MSEWDEYADGWDDDPMARAYALAAFDSLVDYLSSGGAALDGARVVDFGCGTGLLTERLVQAGAAVLAVDTSMAMLDVVRAKVERHGWESVTTASTLPLAEAGFDVIVCSSVCAFVEDYPATVQSLVSRLRAGGRFVQWDWERTDDHADGLSADEIRAALRAGGLDDVDVRTGFEATVDEHVMAPLMGTGQKLLARSSTQ